MHETASRSRRWPGTGICSGTLENWAVKGRRRREGTLCGQVLGAASERQRQDEPALGKQKETQSHIKPLSPVTLAKIMNSLNMRLNCGNVLRSPGSRIPWMLGKSSVSTGYP